jgi:hypothetical protein
MLALEIAGSIPGILNISRILEREPGISFVLAWTQLEIIHNAETKQFCCLSILY